MSDTKQPDDKTLSVERRKTLSLRRTVETGTVRQNFPRGRSKAVVVEKKKRRTYQHEEPAAPAETEAPAEAEAETPAEQAPVEPAPAEAPRMPEAEAEPAKPRPSAGMRTLTEEERGARAQALAEARAREDEERERAKREAEERAREEERRQKEREEEERSRAEEQARHTAEETAAEAAPPAPEAPAPTKRPAEGQPAARQAPAEEADAGRPKKKEKAAEAKPVRRGEERRRGKLTLSNALEDSERSRSMAAIKRRREREKRQSAQRDMSEKVTREVVIPESITVQELANRMATRAVDVIKYLMQQGQMLKINDVIDAETAQLVAEEMGHTVKRVSEADVEEGLFGEADATEDQVPRAPVVTIMGHVDHGKTSLLDVLRETNVVSGEAGGITQHIGAYQATSPSGGPVTFIDTPGHAAFTSMRARGAKVTDLVILVVAADDGVMPQTVEAIEHARAAEVPIIVAINKMDKPEADPSRVRTDLLRYEVVVESMGGDVLEVEVSALKHQGLDALLEAVQLQAELLELRANPDRAAEGVVVEAKLDKGRGPVGTVLVQRGTLRVGDVLVVGAEWGKVRALVNDRGQSVSSAGPSMPVEILGLNGTPEAGDSFAVVESEARAREISEYRHRKRREMQQARGAGAARSSLEQMMSELKEQGREEFPLVVKADVQGSAEAIQGALDSLATDEVAARILLCGVGGITESDVTLAAASGGIIIGFNVRANRQAREAAERDGVEIRYYNVIYDLVDDVKQAMSGLLAPSIRETFLGNAEILQVFNISKVGKVAGCRVTEGTVQRGAQVRLIRDDVVVHEGKLSTLKRFKDEVREVVAGQECGMAFESYQDMRSGDVIECYTVEEVKRSL